MGKSAHARGSSRGYGALRIARRARGCDGRGCFGRREVFDCRAGSLVIAIACNRVLFWWGRASCGVFWETRSNVEISMFHDYGFPFFYKFTFPFWGNSSRSSS